jgi:hypothetical protein
LFEVIRSDCNHRAGRQDEPKEARELISEDGYFGVEKTSQLIVDFAVNAFDGDPERLQEMMDASDKVLRRLQKHSARHCRRFHSRRTLRLWIN